MLKDKNVNFRFFFSIFFFFFFFFFFSKSWNDDNLVTVRRRCTKPRYPDPTDSLQLSDRLFRLDWMRTAFSAELNEERFFKWVEWRRHFQLGWMRTAFSDELNGDGFFKWVGWGRLFQLGWMGTAFSDGLAGDGFFIWAGWGQVFSKLYTLSHQLFLLTHLRSEVANRLVQLRTDEV
jgi:hypothetical protein